MQRNIVAGLEPNSSAASTDSYVSISLGGHHGQVAEYNDNDSNAHQSSHSFFPTTSGGGGGGGGGASSTSTSKRKFYCKRTGVCKRSLNPTWDDCEFRLV